VQPAGEEPAAPRESGSESTQPGRARARHCCSRRLFGLSTSSANTPLLRSSAPGNTTFQVACAGTTDAEQQDEEEEEAV